MSTTLFHLQGSSPVEYALAGSSPGTPANWLPVLSKSFADQLARVHGDPITISQGVWDKWKEQYEAPLKVQGGDGGTAPSISAAEIARAVNDDAAKRLAE